MRLSQQGKAGLSARTIQCGSGEGVEQGADAGTGLADPRQGGLKLNS